MRHSTLMQAALRGSQCIALVAMLVLVAMPFDGSTAFGQDAGTDPSQIDMAPVIVDGDTLFALAGTASFPTTSGRQPTTFDILIASD